MNEHDNIRDAQGLSADEVVDGELADSAARFALARIEKVMHDLAGVAEQIRDDYDP